VLLTRDGTTTTRWPSHGALTATADGAIRTAEMDNRQPSPTQFRHPSPGREPGEGPHLPGYYTAPPATDTHGTTVLWRNGSLTAIDADMTPHHLHTIPGRHLGGLQPLPVRGDDLVHHAG
jgi:hypothetical protein